MTTVLGYFSQNGVKNGSEVFCKLLNNNENSLSSKSIQYFEKTFLIPSETFVTNQIQNSAEAILTMRQVNSILASY